MFFKINFKIIIFFSERIFQIKKFTDKWCMHIGHTTAHASSGASKSCMHSPHMWLLYACHSIPRQHSSHMYRLLCIKVVCIYHRQWLLCTKIICCMHLPQTMTTMYKNYMYVSETVTIVYKSCIHTPQALTIVYKSCIHAPMSLTTPLVSDFFLFET